MRPFSPGRREHRGPVGRREDAPPRQRVLTRCRTWVWSCTAGARLYHVPNRFDGPKGTRKARSAPSAASRRPLRTGSMAFTDIRPGPHPVACDLFLRIGVEAGNAPHPKWGQDVHPALGKILSGSTTATESGVAGREPGQTGPVSAKSPCRGCIFPQHAAVADACGGQAFGPERRRGADPS